MSEHRSAVRLTIPGKFWDSQLYSGTLYLFDMSGGLWTVDWNKLVASIKFPTTLKVAANLALKGNHRLYETGAQVLLSDPSIRQVLEYKFQKLSMMPAWEVRLADDLVQDNPFPFPHNDSELHYDHLYIGASDGLYSLVAGKDRDAAEPLQLSEVPALRIAAKFRTIIQAAGSDGLFAVRPSGTSKSVGDPLNTRVSELPCVTCEWAFNTVIAAGFDNSIYMVPYELPEKEDLVSRSRRAQRTFRQIIRDDLIFKSDNAEERGFSWGAGNRLFRFDRGGIRVVEYAPKSKKTRRFNLKGKIVLKDPAIGSQIVAARSAPFGSVIEEDNSLMILLGTGEVLTLMGEPTNWRVFPRSKNYINHLHVIYEDHLEIWAFTHDYFLDQSEKLFGISAGSLE